MAAPPPCQTTPISTVFETTTITSLIPTESGSTTYVLVDPQAETVATSFITRPNGRIEPVLTTVLGATITTTEALTVTETSLVVTSVPVSTILNSCAAPISTSTSSSSLPTSTSSSTTTSTTSSTTSTIPTTSSTTSTTPSSSLITSSTQSSSASSSSSSISSSASSTGLLPSSNSNASNSSASPSNLSAIIGGSVGGGVGAIILLGLLFWCCCARKRRGGKHEDEWRDPPPFLVGTGSAGNGHGSGEFEEKEPVGSRWDPVGGMASTTPQNGNNGRLSRKFVGAGAGAALAGGVSAYERNNGGGGGNEANRRKSGKFRPADEQDAYYRNTWVAPPASSEVTAPPRRQEPPVSAGFAGVGAGGAGIMAASRIAPPQRQSTVANMVDNATTFDPRARDGGWAVANEPSNSQLAPPILSQSQFQPRNQIPPPAPLALPGSDYRSNNLNSSTQSHEPFLAPPAQSRFNRYASPTQQPPHNNSPRNQTNGYDSPAPSHLSIPALGPYLANSGESERGQLRVTNMGSSTAAGSEWGSDVYGQPGQKNWSSPRQEEIQDDNDPYGGLDAGLDHQQMQRRY